MMLTGENLRARRKTCLSVTLSTTNPTWIDLGANPGLPSEKPSTNRLPIERLVLRHILAVTGFNLHPETRCLLVLLGYELEIGHGRSFEILSNS
jgi:hypothetical protein